MDIPPLKEMKSLMDFNSNDLLFSVLHQISIATIITDHNGYIIYLNPLAERYTGCDKKDAYGKEFSKAVSPIYFSSGQSISNYLNQVIQRQETQEIDPTVAFIQKDGTEVFFTGKIAPIVLKDGSFFGVLVSFWKVTQHTNIDELLREKNEQFELALTGSQDGLWDWNLLENKVYFSPIWKSILGYQEDELPNTPDTFEELLHPEDRPWLMEKVQKYLNEELQTFNFDFRMKHKSGDYKWINSQGEIFKDEQGNIYRMSGTHIDITERKTHELALKESEERYHLIADNISDIIWVRNITLNKYTYISPTVLPLTGYTPEEYISLRDEDIISPETLDNYKKFLRDSLNEFLEDPEKQNIHYFEIQRKLKNGKLCWFELSLRYRINKVNEIEAYGVSRNIDERKQTEAEILYLSYHDILTGLYNRRFIEEEIHRLNTIRNLPFTFLIGDLNRLKLINDAFGHDKGDEFIKLAAAAIRSSCRPDDLIARWGGDEFLIALPKTSREDAVKIIERIQKKLEGYTIYLIPLSISFGVATKMDPEESLLDIFRKADDEMYKAKQQEFEHYRGVMVETIAKNFFEKLPNEHLHSMRVGALCRKIATVMGLDENEINKIEKAGIIHDIGKVAIRIQTLQKPGQFNQEEWDEIKAHAEIGAKIIRSSKEMGDISAVVFAHHERFDGTGYPQGIKGDVLPLAAKIIAIADSFDTMTHDTVYRKKMNKKQAIEEIQKHQGSQFDPEIVKLFIEKVLKE